MHLKIVWSLFTSLLVLDIVYVLITTIAQYQSGSPGKSTDDGWRKHPVDPVIQMPENNWRKTKSKRFPFHVAMTADDTPYSKWQCRIMYYWYMKKKDLPGSDMGKFTRILHSGREDNLMSEIPTFVVDPLPEGLDMGYVVLNRPWAFMQWLKKAEIEEEYILMAEPDHIFLQPLPNLAYEEYPSAFPFLYITPMEHEKVIRKFFPPEMGPVTNIQPIGNSLVIIKKSLLRTIAPTWMNVSMHMKYDEEANVIFMWVLEMYGYAVASALHGVTHILYKDFLSQPPDNKECENNYILHYTYCSNFNSKGEILNETEKGVWGFYKRSYHHGPPPRNLSLPPKYFPKSVITLITLINEATANIPNWDSVENESSTELKSNKEVVSAPTNYFECRLERLRTQKVRPLGAHHIKIFTNNCCATTTEF